MEFREGESFLFSWRGQPRGVSCCWEARPCELLRDSSFCISGFWIGSRPKEKGFLLEDEPFFILPTYED